MEGIGRTAEVSIQGDHVLRFVNSTGDRAIYEIIGFSHPRVTLIDYRKSGIQALNNLLETGNLYDFAPMFNTTASVRIQQDDEGNIFIELGEPSNEPPDDMLWIVVGLRDEIPNYDYHFQLIAPLPDETFALASLFSIPFEEEVEEPSDGFSGCSYST